MNEPWDLWVWRKGKVWCASYIVTMLYCKVAWEITNVVFKLFGG